MNLMDLQYLLAIVDADLNISAAAQRVHGSQPNLSRHLKQLEDELGFPLFTRRGRSLTGISPGGREVIRIARRIVADAARLRVYAARLRGDPSGEFTLATAQTYARHVLPPLLAQLVALHPGLNVRLYGLGEGEDYERPATGNVDLVLLSAAGDAAPAGTRAVPLFSWRRVVIVPRGHPLAGLGRAPTLAEMAAYALVSYDASRRPESTLCRALARAGLGVRFACSAPDADLIKTYVRAGLGVGLMAELAVEPDDHREFVVLPADPALPGCTAWAAPGDGCEPRECTLDLIGLLAPQLERDDVRRYLAGEAAQSWPPPPRWPAAERLLPV